MRLPPVVRAREAWLAGTVHYVVTPQFISPEFAADIAAEYPPPDSTAWHTFSGPLEEGKQEASAAVAGPHVGALHDMLASAPFVEWLCAVSGIGDLVADPDRVGGGIHQVRTGGRLGLHVDFNLHPQRPDLVRAVNVIVFVGTHVRWEHRWGGEFILMGAADHSPVVLQPMPGTVVVFEANDTNYHGHPTPLAPDAPLRRSVPAYYYRPVADGETIVARSTRFLDA